MLRIFMGRFMWRGILPVGCVELGRYGGEFGCFGFMSAYVSYRLVFIPYQGLGFFSECDIHALSTQSTISSP